MGEFVIVHRYEETASGRLVVAESGVFDPDATDNPSWVGDALDAVEDAPEEQPRLVPTDDQTDRAQPAATLAGDAPDEADAEDDDEEVDGPPPTSGTGSGKSAWVDYAGPKGVTIEDAMTRDDIIAACKAKGIPTE